MNNKFLLASLFLSSITIATLGTVPSDTSSDHTTHVQLSPHMSGQHEQMEMHGMYGAYPMTREASGTSWVPDSSPPEGFYLSHEQWMFMLAGFSYLVCDVQRGNRGDTMVMDENMFMFMGQKDFNRSTLAFRTMVALEPLTIGKCGYPLLLQTGETCNGRTPLIDRQHPHDLFGELAGVFTYRPTEKTSLFLYAGLPGEPALGPPTYFMRFSAEYIPETPITHHWLDSTHISFGVITAGLVWDKLKLEVSGFRGREPDQHRFDIEKPKLDSYAFRCSLNPTKNWALQASYGLLKSPEQLEPDVNIRRTTISAIYNKNFAHAVVQAAAIVGINTYKPGTTQLGTTLPGFLVEATAKIHEKHVAFSRFEFVKKNELFVSPCPFAHEIFGVKKVTLGYIYEFASAFHLLCGIGGLVDFPVVPTRIKSCYGSTNSFMAFLQIRLI